MEFSVCSYDICWAYNGTCEASKKIYAAIKDIQSDVVCIQESHRKYEKNFAKNFRKMYPYRFFHSPEEYPAGGMGIMSKYPMRELVHKHTYSKDGKRVNGSIFRQQIVEVTLSKTTKIIVVNVHLRAGKCVKKSGFLKHLRAYLFDTEPIRFKELQHIFREIERLKVTHLPIVFAGNFNEGRIGKSIRNLKSQGFVDGVGNAITWVWPVFWFVNIFACWDHIFYNSEECELKEKKVFRNCKYISDHLPILCKFKLSGKIRKNQSKDKGEVKETKVKDEIEVKEEVEMKEEGETKEEGVEEGKEVVKEDVEVQILDENDFQKKEDIIVIEEKKGSETTEKEEKSKENDNSKENDE